MASTTSSCALPSGCAIFTKMPELLFIPEFVAGGLVWISLAFSNICQMIPHSGWVMFVAVFCFVVTTIWFVCFASGVNQKGAYWPTLDVAYHAIAAAFYFSAAILLAFIIITLGRSPASDVTAVVMAYIATLLYAVHTVLSAIRWKSS